MQIKQAKFNLNGLKLVLKCESVSWIEGLETAKIREAKAESEGKVLQKGRRRAVQSTLALNKRAIAPLLSARPGMPRAAKLRRAILASNAKAQASR